jgi:hypothetical protein
LLLPLLNTVDAGCAVGVEARLVGVGLKEEADGEGAGAGDNPKDAGGGVAAGVLVGGDAKAEAVYQHVYDAYAGEGRGLYGWAGLFKGGQ